MEFNMTRQIQIRRGTATENDAFTGAIGEITMDTTNNTLRIHDGTTPGGTVLAKKSEIPSQQTINTSDIFQALMPNYSASVTMSANTTHTATSNGWVFFYQFNNGDRWFYINGIQFHLGAGNASDKYSGNCVMMPISKGQTFMGNETIIFFPCVNA